ncbi:GNAT family N-acetyltransferase [Olivibacter sp. CPCC 100613]|uniref:GNAT family N-acetyltransferase n=1 Tax=Olivibacter sp. CPCC 100613 TaxID=3079931 RepID=UPI002FF52CB7
MENYYIKHATLVDVEDCVSLFDSYRIFYKAKSDVNSARQFIKMRLKTADSKIFLFYKDHIARGFAQAYFSYSSLSLAETCILNDLFVTESERGQGYGTALIEAVRAYATQRGCVRLSLSTAKDNPAQHLYEAIGFKQSDFKFYNLMLKE